MWFQIDRHTIMVHAPEESLRWAIDSIPLPLQESPAPANASATLRLATCSSGELKQRAAAAMTRDGLLLNLPASPEMGVAADLLVGPDGAVFFCEGHGMASVSADGARAEVLAAEPDGLPAASLAASAVLAMVAEFGFSPIHASLVDRDGSAVMFCGERSRGKSSSCMALARAGWTVRADDRCFVHTRDERVIVWGGGGRVSLRPGAATLWPDLAETMERGRSGAAKHLVEAAAIGGHAEAGSVVCGALLFPEVVGEGPHRVEPMPRADALSEMLFTTGLAAVPDHAALHFRHLTALIEQTPCYRLRLGAEMDDLPATIAGALS